MMPQIIPWETAPGRALRKLVKVFSSLFVDGEACTVLTKTPSCIPQTGIQEGVKTRYHLCFADPHSKRRISLCGQPTLSPDDNGSVPFQPTEKRSAGRLWNRIHRTLPPPFHQPEALLGKGMTRPRCSISAFYELHFIPGCCSSQSLSLYSESPKG